MKVQGVMLPTSFSKGTMMVPFWVTVTSRAQPPRTDVPQPRTDLSHGARTFSEVGTRCTATSHMTSLLVYIPFSRELSSLSLNLILDIPYSCDITP